MKTETVKGITELIRRSKNDPVLFAKSVIRANPTEQQIEILNSIANGNKVAVKAGHGIGKSACISWVVLWYLVTRPISIIPITAPTMHQLKDVLWAEIGRWLYFSPILKELLEFTSERLHLKGNQNKKIWFATPVSARKPENLQGFHGKYIMFVGEEASGIPDENFAVIEGALTTKGSKMLLVGNPTQPQGYFFDAFHKNSGMFDCLTMSSLDSPLVDKSYGKEMAKKYGKTSNIFRARVLGEFPMIGVGNNIIPNYWIEKAFQNENRIEDGKIRFGVDVARYGDDETVIVIKDGYSVKNIIRINSMDTVEISDEIVKLVYYYQPHEVVVETAGVGAGVFDNLKHKKVKTKLLQFEPGGLPANKKYENIMTEAWWNLRECFNPTKSGLPLMSLKEDEDVLSQLSSRNYVIKASGKIGLEDKATHKKRNGNSPDIGDAMAMAFYDGNLKGSLLKSINIKTIGGESLWDKWIGK